MSSHVNEHEMHPPAPFKSSDGSLTATPWEKLNWNHPAKLLLDSWSTETMWGEKRTHVFVVLSHCHWALSPSGPTPALCSQSSAQAVLCPSSAELGHLLQCSFWDQIYSSSFKFKAAKTSLGNLIGRFHCFGFSGVARESPGCGYTKQGHSTELHWVFGLQSGCDLQCSMWFMKATAEKEWHPPTPYQSGHANMRCSSRDLSVATVVERMVWIRNHEAAHRHYGEILPLTKHWWTHCFCLATAESRWCSQSGWTVSGLVIHWKDGKDPRWETTVHHGRERGALGSVSQTLCLHGSHSCLLLVLSALSGRTIHLVF